MAENQVFECKTCGSRTEVDAGENKVPECCGKPMQPGVPLDTCQLSNTPEHSRFDDFDEPCDDGRAGS